MSEQEQDIKGGSIGAGTNALLTIVTVKTESDETVEETFRVPYIAVDQKKLQELLNVNFIRGYKLEKLDEGKTCPFHTEEGR